ncbi:MAG: CAP domain-containing protein [Clostridiales bacterium]|jgi:uncharacterized protein YkwD|nr:CAP domain-containing protein [Clostridiales bacterium]
MKKTSKTATSFLLSLVLIIGSSSFLNVRANPVAQPTTSTILIDGVSRQFDAYNIDDFNYFKLRDLANVLAGTNKPFSVGWDDNTSTITLTKYEQYVPVGGEGELNPNPSQKDAEPTSHKLLVDGILVTCAAYNIDNLNYFKLRDIGASIDFSIAWDEANNVITIDTFSGYESADPTEPADPSESSDPEIPAPTDAPPEETPAPTSTPVPVESKTLAGVSLGDSASDVDALLGTPYKVITGTLEYRFYGAEKYAFFFRPGEELRDVYKPFDKFAMVGFDDGIVKYVYSNYGFTDDGKKYTDSNASKVTYACDIGTPPAENDVSIVEAIIFETTNAFRGFNGLDPFFNVEPLGKAARLHSEDQVARNYFDHVSPDGKTLTNRINAQGYKNWNYTGENIARQASPIGVYFLDSWVNSAGHRGNILRAFNELGVGFAIGSRVCVATQVFCVLSSEVVQ